MAAALDQKRESSKPDDVGEFAADAILGANPFISTDLSELAGAMLSWMARLPSRPAQIASRASALALELGRIATGNSTVAPDAGDRRFPDPAWSEHPAYRRVMQTYLAWRSAVLGLVDDGNGDWRTTERVRFAMTLLTEALAPTNSLAMNPAALKRAFETGGASLLRGARNFIDDLIHNSGMPSQVDKEPFKVGKNLGVSPGAVVHRGELCEVIQYQPSTAKTFTRPLILVPPQINKFYIMDLAPDRSLVQYAVARGIPFYAISWRNPSAANRDWNVDSYVGACKEAVDVACEISGADSCNVLGVCAGGITSTLMVGHLAASGNPKVNSLTLPVTMLDVSLPSMTTMSLTERSVANSIRRSRSRGGLSGKEMARSFAWMRPNDLVWNYWVNNYLMGNEPPAFDILFWNNDSTSLPAGLHEDFLNLLLNNSLVKPGATKVLGTPVDLQSVGCDVYILAGITDHICTWKTCYRSTELFGGATEFVLTSSGHVQSLVSPPGNFKARYFVNSRLGGDADSWLRGATEHKGSWWEHWLGWLSKRSGEERPAPEALGSARYPAGDPAPGRYVHQPSMID